MSAIYDQHAKAFAHVSAFIVLDQAGDKVATVAIKFPRDGAGRLWAYVHIIGAEMARGYADGYGYDKRTPAVAAACNKIKLRALGGSPMSRDEQITQHIEAFQGATRGIGGGYWNSALEAAGYRVVEAV